MTDFFKKTENLLYRYPDYKNHIALKYLDIADMKKEGVNRNSPSIVLYSGGVKKNRQLKTTLDNDEKIKAMLAKTDKTAKLVNRIEAAVEMCCKGMEAEFVELKYFENRTIDEICDKLIISRSTAFRMRNSIISRLSTVFYGVDAAV